MLKSGSFTSPKSAWTVACKVKGYLSIQWGTNQAKFWVPSKILSGWKTAQVVENIALFFQLCRLFFGIVFIWRAPIKNSSHCCRFISFTCCLGLWLELIECDPLAACTDTPSVAFVRLNVFQIFKPASSTGIRVWIPSLKVDISRRQ